MAEPIWLGHPSGIISMAREISQLELDHLLHPAKSFDHPMDVVRARSLSLQQKRAVLASWASDACAIEAAPELRAAPGRTPVKWDDIMDALYLLDGQSRRGPAAGPQPGRQRMGDAEGERSSA
jgi:hypothetical protein